MTIRQLPKLLVDLPLLEDFELSDSAELTHLPILKSFPNLHRLSISYCRKLKAFETLLYYLPQLKELVIQEYYLSEIPEAIGKLAHLERLSVKGLKNSDNVQEESKAFVISEAIGNLYNLTDFHLKLDGSYTVFKHPSYLPETIGNLKALRSLTILWLTIEQLPVSIGKLSNLKKIKLRTKLTVLPVQIGDLELLEVIDLAGNKLSFLPPEIGKLKNLKELKLDGNEIFSLPDELG